MKRKLAKNIEYQNLWTHIRNKWVVMRLMTSTSRTWIMTIKTIQESKNYLLSRRKLIFRMRLLIVPFNWMPVAYSWTTTTLWIRIQKTLELVELMMKGQQVFTWKSCHIGIQMYRIVMLTIYDFPRARFLTQKVLLIKLKKIQIPLLSVWECKTYLRGLIKLAVLERLLQ